MWRRVSIKYAERLAEAGIGPAVGSVGDSYDNALVETINRLYKAEMIHRRGPWRSFEAIEYATLRTGEACQEGSGDAQHHWKAGGGRRVNHRRLLEPIGDIPPAKAKELFYGAADNIDMAA